MSVDERPRVRSELYQSAPVGLCYLDANYRYVEINDWLARFNGLTVEQHLGKTLFEVISDVAFGVVSQLEQAANTKEPILYGRVTATTLGHPHEERTYEHNYFPDIASDGTVVGFNIVVWDVTDRIRAHKQRARPGEPEIYLPVDVSLSPREHDVVIALVQEVSLDGVAAKLSISRHTVRSHLRSIYRKLAVNSRPELLSLVLLGPDQA